MEWSNRILGSGNESPEQLLANPHNFRRHPKHQAEAMASILAEVGWVSEVIVNRSTGNLIDGHLRVELALRNNAETIPVKYVDLSPEEERLVLATFDPISGLAFTDNAVLAELLENVKSPSPAVTELLHNLANEQAVAAPDPEAGNPHGGIQTFSLVVDDAQLATIRQAIATIIGSTGLAAPVDAVIFGLQLAAGEVSHGKH